jgi:hypothetical protein
MFKSFKLRLEQLSDRVVPSVTDIIYSTEFVETTSSLKQTMSTIQVENRDISFKFDNLYIHNNNESNKESILIGFSEENQNLSDKRFSDVVLFEVIELVDPNKSPNRTQQEIEQIKNLDGSSIIDLILSPTEQKDQSKQNEHEDIDYNRKESRDYEELMAFGPAGGYIIYTPQGIKLNDWIREEEKRTRNYILKNMINQLRECADKVSAEEGKKAIEEMERLIKIAQDTPRPRELSGNCYTWAFEVMEKFGNPKTKLFTINGKAWEYPIGIPFTDHWLGHFAIEIKLADGSIYYLDNGWWNHVFEPKDIPFHVTPYTPKK